MYCACWCDLYPIRGQGSGQGHISMHNTCRTTNLPDHLTVVLYAIPKYGHLNFVKYIPPSLNSRDSFLRRKFENQAPISYRTPILSLPTISFELHAKMAEEIDPEKCNSRNFRSSMTLTLTLDGVKVILVRISSWGLPTHQIRSKSDKLFVDIRTDARH